MRSDIAWWERFWQLVRACDHRRPTIRWGGLLSDMRDQNITVRSRPASALRALLSEAGGGLVLMAAALAAPAIANAPAAPAYLGALGTYVAGHQVKTGVLVGAVLLAIVGASVLLLARPASQATVTR
jgi:phage terminase large subunit-like protein